MNAIFPEKEDNSDFLVVLEKPPTQEEFIPGSLGSKPRSSADIGPLMRNIKNHICERLDMVSGKGSFFMCGEHSARRFQMSRARVCCVS